MINLEKEREGFCIKSNCKYDSRLNEFYYDHKGGKNYDNELSNEFLGWLARAEKAEEEKQKAEIDGYNRSVDEIFKLKEEIETLKKINDDYINRNQVNHTRVKDFDMNGYRFLETGEKVISGDEFLGADRRWYPANDIGHTVDTKLLRYRRKDSEQYWA